MMVIFLLYLMRSAQILHLKFLEVEPKSFTALSGVTVPGGKLPNGVVDPRSTGFLKPGQICMNAVEGNQATALYFIYLNLLCEAMKAIITI